MYRQVIKVNQQHGLFTLFFSTLCRSIVSRIFSMFFFYTKVYLCKVALSHLLLKFNAFPDNLILETMVEMSCMYESI